MSSHRWQPPDGTESLPESGSDTPDMPDTPQTAQSTAFDGPLLPADGRDSHPAPKQAPRSLSAAAAYVSSPLNPNGGHHSPPYLRPHAANRLSATFNRVASEEAQALSSPSASPLQSGIRGSMVLYRLASDDGPDSLAPPLPVGHRDSVISSSGASVYTLSSDSKYPAGAATTVRGGFVPYAFDPDMDFTDAADEDDTLHTPSPSEHRSCWSCRGIINVSMLLILILAILALFIGYPVITFYNGSDSRNAIDSAFPINATGQAAVRSFVLPQLIDPDTPQDALSRTGFDGQPYQLVFSDEFNTDGRTFFPGDDPFWEAVDLWYGATDDQEWYDPEQVSTSNGSLRILLEQVDPSTNHGLPYKSGMLQSWNRLCFTGGYIEVALTLPGPDSNATGYWPGVWTLGNLARAGYLATAEGTWPYSYDSCDVGTFQNQTWANGTGPAAAIHSDDPHAAKYDYALSYLPGQRSSACTCPGEDHPGPDVSIGRGAPEIDILEAERNKLAGSTGQVASQSAQFAPFTHDYLYSNDTQDEWWIYNASATRPNPYRGSPVQQAVSALTELPDDMFQGSGQNFHTLGFEYWSDPGSTSDSFITWQADGQPTVTLGASALGPDMGDDGSMVSQRLISQEPLSMVFNLGISDNWQDIDLATLVFPAEMRIDYVRVYQREGHVNVDCSPEDFPTADYINNHLEAYTNANLTSWTAPSPAGAGYSWPKNGLYEGGC